VHDVAISVVSTNGREGAYDERPSVGLIGVRKLGGSGHLSPTTRRFRGALGVAALEPS
jgi:hypothetical protein